MALENLIEYSFIVCKGKVLNAIVQVFDPYWSSQFVVFKLVMPYTHFSRTVHDNGSRQTVLIKEKTCEVFVNLVFEFLFFSMRWSIKKFKSSSTSWPTELLHIYLCMHRSAYVFYIFAHYRDKMDDYTKFVAKSQAR